MTHSLSYKTFVDALEDAFFVFDESGTFIEWNQAVIEISGYSADDLADMSPIDFFHREDAERVEAAIAELFETGESVIEVDLVTAEGETLPFEFKATKLPSSTADPQAYVGIGRDISERKQAERDRQAMLDRMGDAFLALDTEGRITYANDGAKQVLAAAMGRTSEADDFRGLNIWEEVPMADESTLYEVHEQALETQEPVSYQDHYEPLDVWFDVSVYPSGSGVSVYFRDITEQRRQRIALEDRQRVLRQMYDIIANRSLSFGEQVRALLVLGREELDLDYGTLSRIEGEEYIFEYVDAADESIEAGDVVPVSATNCEIAASNEQTLVLGDVARDAPEETDRAGYTEWGISCYIGAPVILDDDVYGTFCFYDTEPRQDQFSDWETTLVDLMTQWIGYELQRQRATDRLKRTNEKLDKFAGIVSHDLRNPLNVALGRLNLAQKEVQSEDLDAAEKALNRMQSMISDMLSLARAGQNIGEESTVNLEELVDQCWQSINANDADLTIEIDRTVTADASQLRHAIENIFRNAIEHGGEDVTITVGELSDGFFVEDDGPGIPAEHQDEIFETGYSTSEEGTGFGLAIAREIIEAHGWTIALNEDQKRGTRFEVRGIK